MKTMPSARWRRALALALLAATSGVTTCAHAEVDSPCLPGLRALSPAQSSKFRLARQGCEFNAPAVAAPDAVSDATQLTFSGPVPSSPLIVGDPRAADQLSMYDLAEQGRSQVAHASLATRAVQLAPQVDAVAQRYDIDPLLLHAIAYVESRHNANAVSHAGARGLMQVMPATGRRFGVTSPGALSHAGTNLEVSATYLKNLQERFGNDLTLILAAYNAGEGAVEKYGRRVPPYAETRDYVQKVLAQYDTLRKAAQQVMRAPKSPT